MTTNFKSSTFALADVAQEPGVKKPDPICTISGLKKQFGEVLAADIDYLEIQRGIITSLIGPNGAGKTTFFNLVTGFEKPNAGAWFINGQPLAQSQPHEIARSKIIRTFQLTKSLGRLSVMENMLLASQHQRGELLRAALLSGWKVSEKQNIEKAEGLLERYGILEMRDEYAASLSGGQRKLLEMARALMADPELLLLDEPLAGVNPALIDSILKHITELIDLGITVLFIEHNIDAVVEISDWVVCLAEGRVIAEGVPENLTQNQSIINAYLGE